MKEDHQQVTLYTTATCPVCAMTKDFLTSLNIDFAEVDVGLAPVQRLKLIGKTKRLTVPQMNIDGNWVSGFDPVRTLEILHNKKTT